MNIEEIVLKVIVIGTSGVGKSSLVYYFQNQTFSDKIQSTTGVEYSFKNLIKEGKNLKLHIWDTAGQERFKSITKSYYRGSLGALIVFDLSSYASFEESLNWYEMAREVCGDKLSGVLVGNKSDLSETR